jgi:hypothetical protein
MCALRHSSLPQKELLFTNLIFVFHCIVQVCYAFPSILDLFSKISADSKIQGSQITLCPLQDFMFCTDYAVAAAKIVYH